jgi:hypothetical protein
MPRGAKESALKALQTGLRFDTRRVRVSFPDTTEPSDAEDGRFLQEQVWHPLHVDSSNGRIFDGWWQRSGGLRGPW